MSETNPKFNFSPELLEKWEELMAAQGEVSSPTQAQAEEFQRSISSISLLKQLEEFTV